MLIHHIKAADVTTDALFAFAKDAERHELKHDGAI
jgi:hypothetical protein